MFIDGRWTSSLSGETFTADSPATGEAIGEVPQGDRDDAQLAIAARGGEADEHDRREPQQAARGAREQAGQADHRRQNLLPADEKDLAKVR